MNMYHWVNTVLIYYCLLTFIWMVIYHLMKCSRTIIRKRAIKNGQLCEKLKTVGEKRLRQKKYQLKKRDSKKETQKKELKKNTHNGWVLLE